MRICFYAGPSAGKSTMAYELAGLLKRRKHSAELVSEYVKRWAYQNKKPTAFDQPYIFGKQQHYEYEVLKGGVKNIVCDSPVYLSHIYAHVYGGTYGMSRALKELADIYEKEYPSVSIYLERGEKPYNPEGRWGTIEEAKRVDAEVLTFLKKHHEKSPETLLISDWDSMAEVLEFAEKHMDK